MKNVRFPGQSPNQEGNELVDPTMLEELQRQGTASSAVTEKRGGEGPVSSTERRLIVTERIMKDKDQIEKFFKDKSEALSNIARPPLNH